MGTMNRRRFLTESMGAGLAVGAGVGVRPGGAAPSDRVIVGLMGCGGQGSVLAEQFARRADVEVRYLCDVDQRRFGRAAGVIDDLTGKVPKRVTDFRRILEDPEVDALLNATPDHWHALGTILACQAGKHVYVEKPASHNIWEGRKMVEAARKYDRVVQVGMQNRSSDNARSAVAQVRGGALGQVHTVRVHQIRRGGSGFPARADIPVPEGMDWDTFVGPAAMTPYPASTKGMYLRSWNFSSGELFSDAIHQLDVARWMIGRTYPHTVHTSGGIYVAQDGRENPDTQTTTWEFDRLLMVFQGSSASAGPYKIPEQIRMGDAFPEWMLCTTRVELYGTDGMMLFGRHGGGWQVFGPDGGVAASEYGRHQLDRHVANFVECVRSGQRPNGDIEEGHVSAGLCHLANISFRLGNRTLRFDGATERFPDDAEANGLLKRRYRAPWVVPEEV